MGVALVVAAIGPAAIAQDSTATLELEAGYGAYVNPLETFDLRVIVTSSELFNGRLEANVLGVSASIEIPAGGSKSITLRIPPVGEQRRVTLRLVDTSGEATAVVATETLQTRTPGDAILVAVVGAIDLGQARSFPLERDLFTVGEQPSGFSNLNTAVAYVVAADGALVDRSTDDRDALLAWIRSGGVLVAAQRDVESLSEDFAGGFVDAADIGSGRIVVADTRLLEQDGWDRVFIDTPSVGNVVTYFDPNAGSLDVAAVSARPFSVPALPWLVSGIALFALFVGPVNFLLLRRVGRPELAWVTIPVASLVFFVAFLVVGQKSVDAEVFTSAVALYESDAGTVGNGSLVVSAKGGRTVTLDGSSSWSVAPSSGGFISTVPAEQQGADSLRFEFVEAGVGSAQITAVDIPGGTGLSVVEVSGVYTVANNSGATLWIWGVIVGGEFAVSGETLESGETAVLKGRLSSLREWGILNQAVDRSGVEIWTMPNPENRWRQIESLSPAMESVAPLRDANKAFVFGVSNNYRIETSVSGKPKTVEGVAVLVREFDAGIASGGAGSALPELVRALGAEFIELNFGSYYIYGAEEIVVRFDVPDAVTTAKVIRPISNSELFNWSTSVWDGVSRNDTIVLEEYRGPDGYVLARGGRGDQFEEGQVGLGSRDGFRLDWVAGS
ncbi:MAG: hypothetical protein IIC71_09885 [Acidobacteria bacterium]|nr:hypothetical protein [Acidobacteriota bacterium]